MLGRLLSFVVFALPDAGVVEVSAPPETVPLAEIAPNLPFENDTAKRTFKSKCAMCHGAEGKGNGRMRAGLGARDVTSGAWQDTRSDDQIRASIMEGLPGTTMRAWKANGTPAQFEELVSLIRSMRAADAGIQ